MRRVAFIVLVAILALLSFQIYNLNNKRAALSSSLKRVDGQVQFLDNENKTLQADLEYFADPFNLAKELKSKFNFKRPGEKLFIVSPANPPQ